MKFTAAFLAILSAASLASAAALPAEMQAVESRGRTVFGGDMTWYDGASLQGPACGGPAPNDNSLAVAVASSSPAKCNQQIKITYRGKSVTARVRDRCAGCAWNSVDGTKRVFRALAPLDQGRLRGIKYTIL